MCQLWSEIKIFAVNHPIQYSQGWALCLNVSMRRLISGLFDGDGDGVEVVVGCFRPALYFLLSELKETHVYYVSMAFHDSVLHGRESHG